MIHNQINNISSMFRVRIINNSYLSSSQGDNALIKMQMTNQSEVRRPRSEVRAHLYLPNKGLKNKFAHNINEINDTMEPESSGFVHFGIAFLKLRPPAGGSDSGLRTTNHPKLISYKYRLR